MEDKKALFICMVAYLLGTCYTSFMYDVGLVNHSSTYTCRHVQDVSKTITAIVVDRIPVDS